MKRFLNGQPTAADLTQETKDKLLRAATDPRGSEDDMFCAFWVPAFLEALEEKDA